jgi:hypothetical protein
MVWALKSLAAGGGSYSEAFHDDAQPERCQDPRWTFAMSSSSIMSQNSKVQVTWFGAGSTSETQWTE